MRAQDIAPTNNAITSEPMQADARQTDAQDKPHKTQEGKKARPVSVFVVTDNPEPVKLPGVELPTLDRVPTYAQRIVSRFKLPKNSRVYKTMVTDIKALKNDCGAFVGTVSHSRAEGVGGMVRGANTS